jgi:ABC-type transport system substrate-binding protein
LEELRQEFLFKSAAERFRAGELRQTLSALEELRSTAPAYQTETVLNVLSRVADSLISGYQQEGQLGTAKILLERIRNEYGASLPVVQAWQTKLKQLALQEKAKAQSLFAEKKYRQARGAAMSMLGIFPDLEEGKELIEQINREHPMVRVGVMQRSTQLDPSSLVDWPARRGGSLVHRSLFQFLETGAEGGRYAFALGTFRISDDRQQLVLSIDPTIQSTLNAFDVAQLLLARADAGGGEDYDASWAAILGSIQVTSDTQVIVQLKRPNVLPHALLQWKLASDTTDVEILPGPYQLASDEENEVAYSIRESTEQRGQPVEIVEVFYDDPKQAVNDLLVGNIDVLDQLYPADAKRLASDSRLRINSYALPTTHMLIPVSDHEYLANEKFRRALLYATDRQGILAGELLGSGNPQDGRLISGPFPIGSGQADPLAYAYDPDIQPIAYSPQLARILLVMTRQQLHEAADKADKIAPEMKPLIVGCPDFEFARVAVQALIQQWAIVGIEAQMLVLPTDKAFDADCDLLYVTTTMWEPATDIERLLGGDGKASSDNPFVILALDKLREARNWRQVRAVMQDMHRLVDYHLPVLPLWQVTDRFAYRRYVEGLDDHPISLYQDIASWRVNLGQVNVAQ